MKLTQAVQRTIQNRLIARVLASRERPKPPALVRLLGAVPILRRLPARVIGLGFRPEHIRSPEVQGLR